jgi:putative colanic acid biosynthesis glycosyltransferase WcaI
MNILFLAQCYAPEDVSGAVLISELAIDLAEQGHKVSVVTCAPNYPYGQVFPGYRNRLYQVEQLNKVRVVRTWSYISPQKTFWRRIATYGTFSLTTFYGGLLAGKPDILVSYSPPLPLGISAWLLSRIWRIPWVLQLEDLYPDAAVAAGILKNRAVIAFFAAMERFLYQRANRISLICEGFRQNLLAKDVPAEKIALIPVWADPDLIQPQAKENAFRSEHNLTGKFVVMYAGNLGITSSLEDVLEAAKLLGEIPDIRFVIIGEGVKKNTLVEAAREWGLSNLTFLPYQPREVFAEVLAAADLHLVTLNPNSYLTSLPSKLFNIMASARPILVVAPPESEIAHMVMEAECGVSVPPGHSELLADVILGLREQKDRLVELGLNGRSQLIGKYSRAQCVEMHLQMLNSLYQARNHSTKSNELAKTV